MSATLEPVPPSPPLTRVTTTEEPDTSNSQNEEKVSRLGGLSTPEPTLQLSGSERRAARRREREADINMGENGHTAKTLRIPKSSYYVGPPSPTSAYGTDPTGKIGVHYPREVIRIERDYSGGEVVQFHDAYPLELEGRITHTQYQETINTINELLISAHSLPWSFLDNTLAILTLYVSWLIVSTHYDREMRKLEQRVKDLNRDVWNPAGLNILWPRPVAFLFLEVEYY